MLHRALVFAVVVSVGCGGDPPDIVGLSDQVAVVGQQFVLELEGTDPDGDPLSYSVKSDISLEGRGSMSQTPAGRGLFRWTPIAEDVGMHPFDFTVSDGSNKTTVTITIDVRSSSGGLPVFRQPLGSGRVVMLNMTPCVDVDVLIEDTDSAQVTIAEEDPKIDGGMLTQNDGLTATWHWCPTQAQVTASDRYTLTLSADDGDNPKVRKEYVLALSGAVPSSLVINEIDYDTLQTPDIAEYIELYNSSTMPRSLAGLAVILVNGANSSIYSTIDLGSLGTLGPGKYLVIRTPGVPVPTDALALSFLANQDNIQNGDHDGVAIIDTVTNTLVDALAYEGAIDNVTIPGFPAPVSLVEGTVLDPTIYDLNDVTRTLCRDPNGKDTNNANADWKVCNLRTVGALNKVM